MNSDSNSDSEQCTESKLGRVHSAHTHDPGCSQIAWTLLPGRAHSVVSWCTLGHIVVVPGRVTTHTGRVARTRCRVSTLLHSAPDHDTNIASRLNPYRAPCHACTTSCHSVVSQPCCAVSQHQTVSPSHDTNFVLRLTPWPGHLLARAAWPMRRPAM